MWLYRLSSALGKYDPLFIIPMLQSNYILFSTVTGGIFFQEFASLEAAGIRSTARQRCTAVRPSQA